MCRLALRIDNGLALGEERSTWLQPKVGRKVVQQPELKYRSVQSHDVEQLSRPYLLAKVKFDELDEGEMGSIHTCQTNGRFFKLMNARIKASVLHDASDAANDNRSRMLSMRSAAGIADMKKVLS